MKIQLLLCTFAIFGLAYSLKAQSYLGFSAGGGFDNLVSLRASVPVEMELSKTMCLQSGFIFTQQHTSALLFQLGNQRDYRQTTIDYIGFPIFIKYRITAQPFNFYVFAGPQVDYALALCATYVEDGLFSDEKLNFTSHQIFRWNVSAVAGIGVEKEIRNHCKIRFELLRLLGLTDIDERAASSIYTEGSVFNLGFLIPLGQ